MKPAQVEAFHIHVSFETVQVNVIHKAITSCFNRTNPGIGVQPTRPPFPCEDGRRPSNAQCGRA